MKLRENVAADRERIALTQHTCSRTMRLGSRKVLDLFANPALCRELAARARAEVEERWDMAKITKALAESYRREVAQRGSAIVT